MAFVKHGTLTLCSPRPLWNAIILYEAGEAEFHLLKCILLLIIVSMDRLAWLNRK